MEARFLRATAERPKPKVTQGVITISRKTVDRHTLPMKYAQLSWPPICITLKESTASLLTTRSLHTKGEASCAILPRF